MNKELSIAIVKGQIADYAKSISQFNNVTPAELAQILLELSGLFKELN